MREAATSAPKQSEPNEVVRARRRERAVGLGGTLGERKYHDATVPATVVFTTARNT